jgi:cell division protein FtsZ
MPVAAPAPIQEPIALAKSGARTLATAEGKALSARTVAAKDPSLPLDEDQYDIPTFLRRQGQSDMP